MQDVYEKFEFQRIRDHLTKITRTDIGKEKASSLKMYEDENLLLHELNVLEEMRNLIARYGNLPIDVSSDLNGAVNLAKKGGCLSVEDLERVANDVKNADAILSYFKKVADSPLLLEYVKNFPCLSFLEVDIHKIIAPDLSIFDNASPKLKSIRFAIKRLESTMKKKLGYVLDANKEFLSDTNLTLKNGHYVLPVKNSYKNKVRGIVQDVSNTGETTFIEPELLVELNNKMVELHNDEREEIHRLLMELSQEVAGSSEAILENNGMIGYLDFVSAKAKMAEENDCHIPSYSKKPLIDLIEARHPLIDKNKVVANDFRLSAESSLVIISGPNAGGKTVALKTLGLLVMMNQCALAIPTKQGSSLSFFKHIYVDIGDSQSLSDNLSTFSGHMKNIGEILEFVQGKDLVLLDEVGTGTSPKEGEAIALAIMKFLLRKHALTMISSHFDGLKTYALSHKEVINASMMFDEERLLPTYRLKMGLPGESYGLVVAKRFGLPEEVLSEAKKNIDSHEDLSITETIKKLSAVTKETEDLKAELQKKEIQLNKEQETLKSKEKALSLREDHFLSDVEAKKKKMLADYENKIDDIMHSLNKGDGTVKLHEVIEAKHKLNDLEEDFEQEKFDEDLKAGDYVNVPSLFTAGRIKSINGNKIDIVTKEGISMHVAKDKAVRVEEPVTEKKEVLSTISLDNLPFKKSVPLEINLIGQRYEEAERNLAKYLDDCLIKGYKRVRVIHGWGSGILRKMTRNYCDKHKDFVDHYEGADGHEGGGGATIVYLK